MSTTSLHQTHGSRPGSIIDEPASEGGKAGGGDGKGHAKTQCACGKEGKHYSAKALDAILPSTPEKVYNLMFTSEWFKTFLSDNQKLKGAFHQQSHRRANQDRCRDVRLEA